LEARTEALVLRKGDNELAVLEAGDAPVVALAADGRRTAIFAADVYANLFRSSDEGLTWSEVEVPWAGQQLLTLVVADEGAVPIAATHDADSGAVTIWRHSGDAWEVWLERPAGWAGAAVAPAAGGMTSTLIAGEVWVNRNGADWEQVSIPEDAGTVVALAQTGDVQCVVAGRAVLCRAGAGEWESYPLSEAAANPVDVLILADGATLLLDAAGTLWKLEA